MRLKHPGHLSLQTRAGYSQVPTVALCQTGGPGSSSQERCISSPDQWLQSFCGVAPIVGGCHAAEAVYYLGLHCPPALDDRPCHFAVTSAAALTLLAHTTGANNSNGTYEAMTPKRPSLMEQSSYACSGPLGCNDLHTSIPHSYH